MVWINGTGVPVVWLLSNSRTASNYEDFFHFVLSLTQEWWQPNFILGDFENALWLASKPCSLLWWCFPLHLWQH
jgi:hypothetical protein